MQKKLILLRGLPGSGKTTFAKFLASWLDLTLDVYAFAADDFFYDDDGVYHFNRDMLHKAHMNCEQSVEVAMQTINEKEDGEYSGGIIMVHNTFTTEKEMKPYLKMAKQYGFEVTSLIVENRHGNESVHNVPDEAMQRMKGRFTVKI